MQAYGPQEHAGLLATALHTQASRTDCHGGMPCSFPFHVWGHTAASHGHIQKSHPSTKVADGLNPSPYSVRSLTVLLVDPTFQVAQQLPLIKAELGDQQALLFACNQFLEDMAERHLDLLLQQQTAQRLAASRPNTPTAACVDAMTLQAYAQLQEQVQEVSAQLVLQRQQADELLQQKDTLNKQLRIVTMEREELKQQLMVQQQEGFGSASQEGPGTAPTEDADAVLAASAQAHAELQETIQQLTQVQEKLLAAEERLGEALDSNKQLTEQLQAANSIAEAARASALSATSAASAQSYVQLQEASAKVAALEAQLAAAEQHGSAVAASNAVLQQQLQEAHAQVRWCWSQPVASAVLPRPPVIHIERWCWRVSVWQSDLGWWMMSLTVHTHPPDLCPPTPCITIR